MSDVIGQNTSTDPVVQPDELAWSQELSRLCTVNSITSANQNAVISALTDAQIAAIVRRWLIKGFKITP